jgi:hypothetical protein
VDQKNYLKNAQKNTKFQLMQSGKFQKKILTQVTVIIVGAQQKIQFLFQREHPKINL